MKALVIVMFLFLIIPVIFSQEDSKTFIQDANKAFSEKEYEKAIGLYEKALQIGINDSIDKSWVLGYAAICSEELNSPGKAKEYYTQALNLGYPNPSIYNKMYSFSKKNNDFNGQEFAMLKLKQNFKEESNSANNRLVNLYNSSKEFEKLNELYDEFLQNDSNNFKMYYNKATVLGQLNKLKEAREYFFKALKLNPDDPGSNKNVGLMYYNEGTVIYDREKAKYNKLSKPTQTDYIAYQRNIRKGKDLYLQAEPYLLKAYNSEQDLALKKALFAIYDRTEQPAKAQKYK